MITQGKVSLTPKDDKSVYTQTLPVPLNLKEDLTVELALMHRHDPTFLQIRQPHLRSTETQRQTEATGRPTQDQRAHRR